MIFTEELKFNSYYVPMIEYLSKKNNQENINGLNIFKTTMELFLVGVALGIHENKLGEINPKDKRIPSEAESDKGTKIFLSTLNNNARTIDYLYTIAMLTYRGTDESPLSEKERIERAFRIPNMAPEKEEEFRLVKECRDIFVRYGLGGIEYMYTTIKREVPTPLEGIDQERLQRALFRFLVQTLDVSSDELNKLQRYIQ